MIKEVVHKTIISVTCFCHYQNRWLFIHRTKKGSVSDYLRLNGIGGKVKRGESFLHAAIRETEEEIGLNLSPANFQLKALVSLSEGYPEDWLMAFFRVELPTNQLPVGESNDEGILKWLSSVEVLQQENLVDDIHYIFDHIQSNSSQVWHIQAKANDQEKICSWEVMHSS